MLKAGIRLKEAREEKGLSLEEVSKQTKIKTAFLESIENGEYNNLPSSSYALGFVRNYARFLGIKDTEILPLFKREYDSETAYKVLPQGFESQAEFPIKGIRFKQTFLIGILVFIIFILYIMFQYRYAFLNPPLELYLPNQQTVKSSEIIVSGSTDPNSTVYVNNDVVTVSANGKFNKTLNVFPGPFLIDVKAINKFGRVTEVKKNINVKPAY